MDPANSRVGLRIIYKCSQGKRAPVSPCYRNEPGPGACHMGSHNTGTPGCAAKWGLSTRYRSKKMANQASDLFHRRRGVRCSREEGWKGRRSGVGAVGKGKGDWKVRFTVLRRPKESEMQSSTQSQKQQNDLCSFPRQTIQYHSNPSLCPDQ